MYLNDRTKLKNEMSLNIKNTQVKIFKFTLISLENILTCTGSIDMPNHLFPNTKSIIFLGSIYKSFIFGLCCNLKGMSFLISMIKYINFLNESSRGTFIFGYGRLNKFILCSHHIKQLFQATDQLHLHSI